MRRLLEAGFDKNHITVVCSDDSKEQYFREFEHQEPAGTFTPQAALAGAAVGALLGGLPVIGAAVATGSVLLWVAGPAAAGAGRCRRIGRRHDDTRRRKGTRQLLPASGGRRCDSRRRRIERRQILSNICDVRPRSLLNSARSRFRFRKAKPTSIFSTHMFSRR